MIDSIEGIDLSRALRHARSLLENFSWMIERAAVCEQFDTCAIGIVFTRPEHEQKFPGRLMQLVHMGVMDREVLGLKMNAIVMSGGSDKPHIRPLIIG